MKWNKLSNNDLHIIALAGQKNTHCSIVLSSSLIDRYNLKDQFHINKRLQV